MNAPLETYREKTIGSACRHELFDDRIVSIGYQGLGNVGLKRELLLSELEPVAQPQECSDKTYRWAGVVFAVMGPLSIIYALLRPPFYAQMGFWSGLFFSISGSYVFLRSLQRIEIAIFVDSTGAARLLIAKPGPDAGRFQHFVDRVSAQVSLCRAAKLAEPPPDSPKP